MSEDLKPFSINFPWLISGDCRLDASYYNDETVASRRIVEESGFESKPLGDPNITRDIFNLPRFKRIYTNNPDKGYPYLSAYETFMFRPRKTRWIAHDKAPEHPERFFVKKGWILVYCSGINVGRCVIVNKLFEDYFLTHDIIRVIPTLPPGYIYAFLASRFGNALMRGKQYGAAIPHLEAVHLTDISIPLLPVHVQEEIHEDVITACNLREDANHLLDDAEDLLYSLLNIPRFDESQVPYLSIKPKAFTLIVSEFADRFDASFHMPIVKTCISQMQKGKYPLKRLGDAVIRVLIPPRFKRIYVEPEYGAPFLQGSHIPLIKPYDLKYLSLHAHTDLRPWTIQKDWVLITCSGTIGRISLVPQALGGWIASQHIERIISDPKDPQYAHPGYIAAFLMTPYGQHQLTSKIYGGIVDELTEADTASVWIPDAPPNVQVDIGELVVQAFKMKEEANQIESKAIKLLEDTVEGGHPR